MSDWLDALRWFSDEAARVNPESFVSLPGFLEHHLGFIGAGIGWVAAAAVALATAWYWRPKAGVDAPRRYALAAMAAVLVAPQALFYEVGVTAFALALVASAGPRHARLAIILWTVPWVDAVGTALGIGAVVSAAVLFVTFGWCAWRWRPAVAGESTLPRRDGRALRRSR